MTFLKLLFFLGCVISLMNCYNHDDYFLDRSIPRLQSPADQIAYLRSMWRDGEHTGTIYYDHNDRILEVFKFGQSCAKELNLYDGKLPVTTIRYSHGDSSEPGFISIDTVRREFDRNGRLIVESHVLGTLSKSISARNDGFYKRYLGYSVSGDTILKKWEGSTEQLDPSQITDVSRWEKDDKNRINRHYRLFVREGATPDTVYHFSQRFAYDTKGRLEMAWYDSMFLDEFYFPVGPDTVWYRYNSQNRLVEEEHRYTIDMRNKREIDTTNLSSSDRELARRNRREFFVGTYRRNERTHFVKYHYEKFEKAKHQSLAVSTPE
jgi:hypothetical protein